MNVCGGGVLRAGSRCCTFGGDFFDFFAVGAPLRGAFPLPLVLGCCVAAGGGAVRLHAFRVEARVFLSISISNMNFKFQIRFTRGKIRLRVTRWLGGRPFQVFKARVRRALNFAPRPVIGPHACD